MALTYAGELYASTFPFASDANYVLAPQLGFDQVAPLAGPTWIPTVPTEKRSRVQLAEFRGIGALPRKVEGIDIGIDSIEEHGGKTILFLTYATSLKFSRSFQDDEDTKRLIAPFLFELGACAPERDRLLYASILNDASSGSVYTTNKSKALLATDHPVQGGTVDNLITGDLSYSTALTGWQRLVKQIDYRGKFKGRVPKWLVCSVEDFSELASPLISSVQNPEDASNQDNFFKGKMLPVYEVAKSDADSWIMANENHTIAMHEREAFTVIGSAVNVQGDLTVAVSMRKGIGFTSHLGIVGSAGA